MTLTHVTPSKLSSRIKPPATFVNLSKGNKWSSRLGWLANTESGVPELIGGHTFIPVRLDFAASDPKEVETFVAGKTATIALSGYAKAKGGVALWSPASETFLGLTGVPSCHLIFENTGTPTHVRVKVQSGEWGDKSVVAYVGVLA